MKINLKWKYLGDYLIKLLKQLSEIDINAWIVNPTGSEGYRTAEVTLGGVNTNEISSKTMMSLINIRVYFLLVKLLM